LSRDVAPRRVSGDGTVFTYTVNRQVWDAAITEPYVVALVELAEQPGLRLVTNIVGCQLEDVAVGLPVTVRFEQHDGVLLPVFVPAERA
jgi:uncharacterized OB-fold protein